MSQNASSEEIGEAGMKMFILLYGGKDEDDLCKLRYNQYTKMTAGTNRINPSKLPPSERAAYFHSLRVYLQVVFYINLLKPRLYINFKACEWKNLDDHQMDPLDWGWCKKNGKFHPIMTDQVCFRIMCRYYSEIILSLFKDAAPPDLLKIVRCNCKMTSRNPCGSNICSCRINGIHCVSACGDCFGINCNNCSRNENVLDEEPTF